MVHPIKRFFYKIADYALLRRPGNVSHNKGRTRHIVSAKLPGPGQPLRGRGAKSFGARTAQKETCMTSKGSLCLGLLGLLIIGCSQTETPPQQVRLIQLQDFFRNPGSDEFQISPSGV